MVDVRAKVDRSQEMPRQDALALRQTAACHARCCCFTDQQQQRTAAAAFA